MSRLHCRYVRLRTTADGTSELIYHWSTAGSIGIATWHSRARLVFAMCCTPYCRRLGLNTPLPLTTATRPSAHSKQEADLSGPGFLRRLRAAPLPCGVRLWLCMQQCRRPTKRPQQQLLRVFTSPGPLHPTCMMAQHLSART
jgi:hypothetical protein